MANLVLLFAFFKPKTQVDTTRLRSCYPENDLGKTWFRLQLCWFNFFVNLEDIACVQIHPGSRKSLHLKVELRD